MTKNELEVALEAAIRCYGANIPGAWSVCSDEDFVSLQWICEVGEMPEDMRGDEPWDEWGGNVIIEAAGGGKINDTGCDSYNDNFGSKQYVEWVSWKYESDDE